MRKGIGFRINFTFESDMIDGLMATARLIF
jgi:hypothetical protein